MRLFPEEPRGLNCADTPVITCPICFYDVDEIDEEEPSPFYFDLTCPKCRIDLVVDGTKNDFKVTVMRDL